jgi:hypothetical protein
VEALDQMAGFNHSSSFRRLALAGAVCGLHAQSAAQIVSDSRTEAQDAARQRPTGWRRKKLALMASGALLGVKILRRNTEHVVTLDAHTVKDRLPGRRGFVFRVMGLGLRGFGCHK